MVFCPLPSPPAWRAPHPQRLCHLLPDSHKPWRVLLLRPTHPRHQRLSAFPALHLQTPSRSLTKAAATCPATSSSRVRPEPRPSPAAQLALGPWGQVLSVPWSSRCSKPSSTRPSSAKHETSDRERKAGRGPRSRLGAGGPAVPSPRRRPVIFALPRDAELGCAPCVSTTRASCCERPPAGSRQHRLPSGGVQTAGVKSCLKLDPEFKNNPKV